MIDLQQNLWSNFIGGDKTAFETIYREEVNFLISYGLSVVKDAEAVEDAVQELFVDLWKNRQNLSKEVKIWSYLLVSLKRRLIKNKNLTDSLDESMIKASSLDIQEEIIQKESATSNEKLLQAAIEALSPQQREAIQLRFFQEKSYDEMMGIMGISYQSCRNVVSVAIKQLSWVKEKLTL